MCDRSGIRREDFEMSDLQRVQSLNNNAGEITEATRFEEVSGDDVMDEKRI